MFSSLAHLCAVSALVFAPQAPQAAPKAAPDQGANDFIALKDGRVITGRKVQRAENGLKLVFQNGEVLVPQDLIQDFHIDGEAEPEPESDADKAQVAKGNVRFEGKWMTRRQRDDLLAKRADERRKFFAEMAARREWRNRAFDDTKHFKFEYTLPDHVFANYRDLMETYFEVFVKDWKIKLPRDLGPLKVCLHIDYDSMIEVGGAGPGVLGYFRFVTPMELNFFHDRLDQAFTEEVMFHETNHYLQKLIDLEFSMPHFPGESLAEYYGASKFDPKTKKLTTGLILEGRLCEVQDDISAGNWMGLEKLVSTEGMYEHYNWGWTLVHFLMSTPAHAKKFQKFVIALPTADDVKRERVQAGPDSLSQVEAAEVWRVFQEYMGLKDAEGVKALESQWHEYVKKNLNLVSSRGYEEAAQRAASGYPSRPIKAKRLFQAAIDQGTRNPLTYHRFAMLLMGESGERDKAIELWKKAIELDPLNGTFYGHLGRALASKGQKDEGERLKKLAGEIDPDDPWLSLEELGLGDEDED